MQMHASSHVSNSHLAQHWRVASSHVCVTLLAETSSLTKTAVAAISNPAVAAAAAAHMLTWEDALWLATAGGAAALGIRDKVGCFAVGMEFDALVVDVGVQGAGFEILLEGDKAMDPMAMLECFLNNGDDRNIVQVYVQGQRCA